MAASPLVTGGARGIGRAIAFRLADDGAKVAIVDVMDSGAETARRSRRPRVTDSVREGGHLQESKPKRPWLLPSRRLVP